MMNKYTSLLQKYLKIVIFASLFLSLFLGFGHLFRTSMALESNTSRDPSDYKSAFFEAMQEHDLAKARAAVEGLKAILPPDDSFLTEVAPAYLSDLYIKYAKSLEYDKHAHEMMLAQARKLSPNHPALLALQTPPEPVDFVPPNDPFADSEPQTQVLAQVAVELPPSEPTPAIQAIETIQEVKDGPPRIPYIDPPPLLGFSERVEYEVHDLEPESVPEVKPVVTAPLPTSDPCALSYLTKNHPLTACIDPVVGNRFGPALFVVEDADHAALLAFTQQPITHEDYEVFCQETGQCYQEVQDSLPLIDLSDVQETVHDYNAYCQMTGTCSKIDAQPKAQQKPLTRGEAQRYALWLSKTTGYKYRHATADDTKTISQYFQRCVNTKECPMGILESVASLMQHPDTLLVREIAAN